MSSYLCVMTASIYEDAYLYICVLIPLDIMTASIYEDTYLYIWFLIPLDTTTFR